MCCVLIVCALTHPELCVCVHVCAGIGCGFIESEPCVCVLVQVEHRVTVSHVTVSVFVMVWSVH